jgi:hypothetical protein
MTSLGLSMAMSTSPPSSALTISPPDSNTTRSNFTPDSSSHSPVTIVSRPVAPLTATVTLLPFAASVMPARSLNSESWGTTRSVASSAIWAIGVKSCHLNGTSVVAGMATAAVSEAKMKCGLPFCSSRYE